MKLLMEYWRVFLNEVDRTLGRALYVTSYEHAKTILGNPSSLKNAKKAYWELALKYHPDRNPGNVETGKAFITASEAWRAYQANEEGEDFRYALKPRPGSIPKKDASNTLKQELAEMAQHIEGAKILGSFQKILEQVNEALNKEVNIKWQNIKIGGPNDIIISSNDFSNIKKFMLNQKWEYIRKLLDSEGLDSEKFINDKIIGNLKDIPLHGRMDKDILTLFKKWLELLIYIAPRKEEEEEVASQRKPEPDEEFDIPSEFADLFK